MPPRGKPDDSWRKNEHWVTQTAERLDADKRRTGLGGNLPEKGKHHELLLRTIGATGQMVPPEGATAGQVFSASMLQYRLGEQFALDFALRRHAYMADGRPVQAHVMCRTSYCNPQFCKHHFDMFCECAFRPLPLCIESFFASCYPFV